MIDEIRRSQIIVLLETRDDHLPQPTPHTHVDPGFVHNTPHRESCPDCLANDRVLKSCETCGGRGYLEELHAADPYEIQQVRKYGIDPRRHERVRDRDAQIARLDQQLAPPRTEQDLLDEANAHPYLWERERERKWRDYDYAALDVALELLRDHDQGGYHMLHAVYVYGWQDASAVLEAAVERGLRFLDERMPAVIRAPGAPDPALAKDSLAYGKRPEHEAARERRRERVLRAHFDWGWSTEQVAVHESLSRRRVQQLIAEHNATSGVDAAVASGPAA